MKQLFFPKFKTLFIAIFAGASLLAMPACKKSSPSKPGSIYATIAANPNFTILAAAINKEGLKATLDQMGQNHLTLFAPDNAAFASAGINEVALASLPDSTIKNILLYHVLPNAVQSSQIPQVSNTAVATVNGKPVYVTRTASNKVFVNGIAVTKADINCSNGVIHQISGVLIPAIGTIVQTAQSNPNLSLLVKAVLRASQGQTNVAAVLSGTGPFTVFAPTNQAFANAGFPTEASIDAADPNTLTSILTYHVIAGLAFSSDLVNGSMPVTVNGGKLQVSIGQSVQIKGNNNTTASNVVAANIVASNGVVHVIDQVLLP